MANLRALTTDVIRLVVCTALSVVPVAVRADVSGEVSVAAAHAGLSAGSTDLPTAHAHLQQVLNCLVGPNGKAFDQNALDPCKGLGAGAIPDTSDILKKEMLQRVAARAYEALKNGDLAAVKKDAVTIQTTLKAIRY
jgi:hypothetical protein